MENVKAGDIVWVISYQRNTENSFEVRIYRRKLTEKVTSTEEAAWYNTNMKGEAQPYIFEKDMYLTKEAALKHIMEE